MSNEYKPTYVDNTDNSISIMESTDTISFCKTGTKINTLSAKNVVHKKSGEDLNLCAYDGSSFNPIITINNNNQDCSIMTNLNVSGNLNVIGNGIINTSLGIGTTSLNNGFTGSNVHTNSILDINGQTTISGHILPSQTEQFDLGNAEYKIRHLFLSDNSLWIGDKHKIDVTDGTIKFRKRKTTAIPTSINAIKGGDADDAIQSYIKNKFGHSENPAISDIKLEEWHSYARFKQSNIKIEEIFKPTEKGDWDENDTTMDTLVIKNNIDVSGNLNINSTACINLPVGTEALRPANPIPGTIRYNSETYHFEGYSGFDGGVWISLLSTLPLYAFTSHTFTNAGASGRYGPTFDEMKAAYTGTTWASNTAFFNSIQQGYQIWTVPKTGTYKIRAYGAAGGKAAAVSRQNRHGKGAMTQGDFSFIVGTKLKIIVGQKGVDNPMSSNHYGASGGGATWVLKENAETAEDSNLYCVAGGGGGEKDQGKGGILAGPPDTENAGIVQDGINPPAPYPLPDPNWLVGPYVAPNPLPITNWVASAYASTYHAGGGASYGIDGEGSMPRWSEGGGHPYDSSGALGGLWMTYGAPPPGEGGFGGGGGGVLYHASGGGGGYVGGDAYHFSANRGGDGGSSRNNGTSRSFGWHGNPNGSVKIFFNPLPSLELYPFISHTFTNAAAVAALGPTFDEMKAAYTGTTWANTEAFFNSIQQGYQLWTVPQTGNYTIEVWGAQGGTPTTDTVVGGMGARMKGTFNLIRGEVLKITVGQQGFPDTYKSGGGGGTFVATDDNSPMIIAGGGGGGGNTGGVGKHAVTTEDGGVGVAPGYTGGGGSNGYASMESPNGGYGTKGAGFYSSAVSDTGFGISSNAMGFIYGGTGANGPAGMGGFGGGGGGGQYGGGGGGGYSGGDSGGGGGGSYNRGSNQSNSVQANNGHGKVVIAKILVS